MKFKTTLFISFFFCLFTTFGQQKISGRIIGEDLEIPTEIKVFDKDTTLLGKTDFDGYFDLELPKNSKQLIFAGLGYEWTKITVPENCENLEIILLREVVYDFMSSNKIDRLRKKRFDKISELHSHAFNKGLFKTDKECFKQKFDPIKPELDKIAQRSKEITKENKRNFELLKIGDTITIPFSGTFKYDGTERTSLFVYSYLVEGDNFACKIKGVVTKKQKNRKGYFVNFKVTDLDNCEYKSMIYNDQEVKIGQILEQNMRYFKIITE